MKDIDKELERYEQELINEWDDEALLGKDFMEEERKNAIEGQLDAMADDREDRGNDELLGEDYLDELRQAEIERRLEKRRGELEAEEGVQE